MIIKKIINHILFFLAVFYFIYPAALPLFGFTFIFTLGIIGMILYFLHKFPYPEVVSFMVCFGCMAAWSLICSFFGPYGDLFIFDYAKSQIAWLFSAYFIIYFFYKVYPRGGIHIIIYYIIAAIFVQCVISVAMYLDPAISAFFESLHKQDALETMKRDQTEGTRLIGYGVAFFGAGIACGFALILTAYVFMSRRLNFFQMLFVSFLYSSIFFIGMLSARTTLIGAVASLLLIIILAFKGGGQYKSQIPTFFFCIVILLSVGTTLVYTYFDEFADWAFEPIINYIEKGELRTSSSDGLVTMFILPRNLFEWIIGYGRGGFWGTDVGYTRLLFWFGLPGTILFFTYQYLIIKQAFTSDQKLNIMLVVTFAYNLALNVKGFSDLNFFWLLFAFYFLYYRYYIYTPYLYRLGKVRQTSLRYAVQSQASNRRL